MDEDFLFVYVTCSSAEEADKIAKSAVKDKLAACANIFKPHKTIYRWKGKIEEGEEIAVVFKTTADAFEPLRARIIKLHAYEVPCIVALPVAAGHAPFLEWISQNTVS